MLFRLFNVYSVFINTQEETGGTPLMFDVPQYDNDPDECHQEVIDGLNQFQKMYGNNKEPDTWYVNIDTYDRMNISWTRIY